MNLTMQVVEVAGRRVLIRWRMEGLTEWQSRWLEVGESLTFPDKFDVKLSSN